MKTNTHKQAESKAAPTTAETAKVDATEMAKPVEKKEKKTEERRLYVGPTIYGVARNGSVYIGIPSGVEKARKEVPDLVNLFVPITDYGKAVEQIRKGDGYVAVAYKHAAVYAEKVRNGGIK